MENEILSILKTMQGQMNSMESKIDEHTLILRDVQSIKKDLNQVELVTANNWADIVRLKAVK